MKKLILIAQLFIGTTLFSQGNLQFNRAVHTEISCTNSSGNAGSGVVGATVSIVVPAGKTLKLTSAFIANSSIGDDPAIIVSSFYSKLELDDSPLAFCISNGVTNITSENMFPIWLPEGTYSLKIIYNVNATQANYFTAKAYISGIEFNIIS